MHTPCSLTMQCRHQDEAFTESDPLHVLPHTIMQPFLQR